MSDPHEIRNRLFATLRPALSEHCPEEVVERANFSFTNRNGLAVMGGKVLRSDGTRLFATVRWDLSKSEPDTPSIALDEGPGTRP